MKDEKLKLKNVKDLEYNHLLNKQNIFVIVCATAIISIIFSDNSSEEPNWSLVLTFILLIILFLLHYGKKLEGKLDEIKNI